MLKSNFQWAHTVILAALTAALVLSGGSGELDLGSPKVGEQTNDELGVTPTAPVSDPSTVSFVNTSNSRTSGAAANETLERWRSQAHTQTTPHITTAPAVMVAAESSGSASDGSGSMRPPCADGNCDPRDMGFLDLFSGPLGANAAASEPDPASSVEDVLEKGLSLAEASPAHLAFRGTAQTGSVRCGWRGVARTPGQREDAIRFWLDLGDDDSLPSVSQAETRFMEALDRINPIYPETVRNNFLSLAKGGLSTDYMFLTCYVDYTVQEYLLGSGQTSATLSVAYDRRGEERSYGLYRDAHGLGEFGDQGLFSEGEYADYLDAIASDVELILSLVSEGRESVVFLAPMGAHNAIAVEAWQAVAQWDLQTDDDEVVHAVRYGTSQGDPEHTQTLANLKSRITTAAANDDFADDRIANVSGLTQYYRDIGAYGDITPDDGSTATFAPSQPPDKYACSSGTAVTSPDTNRGLVHDCEALLTAKDTLRGTAALNWGTATAVTSWDGVTTGGTPSRVTKVELSNKSLTGTIPSELGNLFELTHLNLSSNSLTGDIPRELGWLHNLEEIKLSGNSLTGCIPLALKDVATNDLSSLNLLFCRPPAPEGLTAGTAGETSIPLSWTAVANASKYRAEYYAGGADGWIVDKPTITGTSYTMDGLACGSEHRIRVSAYGSGTVYAAEWSLPSDVLVSDTSACVPPTFDASSYSFSVPGDASLGLRWAASPPRVRRAPTTLWNTPSSGATRRASSP